MKILVINPNTTVSMTRKIGEAAKAAARTGTEIIAVNSAMGPASIEGFYDVATCVPGLLAECRNHPDADAVVIACFDDTGLDAVRCLFEAPVVGIGEAAYHAASMIASKFSVITTLTKSIPGLEANLVRYGLIARCARIRPTDIPVLKLEENDCESIDKIRQTIQLAIEEDMAEAIVLGCAGMADLMNQLSREFGIPVVDGVASAVAFAEALVSANLRTSKVGSYASPGEHKF